MKEIKIRVDEKLYELVKKKAEEENKSINALLVEIIERVLVKGEETIDTLKTKDAPVLKPIVALYSAKCRSCGRNILPGQTCYWAKGWGVLCLDCFYKSIGDKSIAQKYIKKKELELAIKDLKRTVDELSIKAVKLKREIEIYSVLREIKNLVSTLYDAAIHLNVEDLRQHARRVEELYDRVKELVEKIETPKVKVRAVKKA